MATIADGNNRPDPGSDHIRAAKKQDTTGT
jgi:hypothetical protein